MCGTIRDTVAPALTTLVEQLDTNCPAWQTINGLLGSLAESQQLLEGAVGRGEATQSFNIGDRGCDEGDGDGSRADGSEWSWSESHDLGNQAGKLQGGGGADAGDQGQYHDGGQSRHWHYDNQCNPKDDQDMGTGNWWESNTWKDQPARWEEQGHGKWTRTSWADAWEAEHVHAANDETGEPNPKHRRQEEAQADGQRGSTGAASPADGTMQQQLHQHQAAAAAAAAAAATAAAAQQQQQAAEAARALAEARRLHAERAAAITMQAIEMGVQPLTQSGEELHMLDPNQLNAWVEEH